MDLKKLSELDKLIITSYGEADLVFSGHSLDTDKASRSLAKANELNIGMEKFFEKHRSYLEQKGCGKEHIEKQLKRVKNLEYYFRYD